ncbi:sigma 54-interacting transcriptional regulator [Pseudomonas phytophila]|uniref:Sigma 54-interacting transcriptional regulator n=1 Tax=Pseudomonas phytophila TaxID=2867264 RepID=A0ABY6FFX0_9PSED|nr:MULTISPECIES: sigma 54-interacting transcriptional regulator [Pseudomonas]MCD5989108.1 sigma-54-dependent Fis family transcriptional regulator [Pseudomonas quasicaspiana]UXZ96579.1 sigma 54-interacting transcriptional regulator [Pseudomonas phytophila]
MSLNETFGQPLLTFPDAEKSPLSIRAKALVFIDPRSRQLREEMEQLAPRALPVLIRGESGTGKELLARHIHRGSDRTGLFVSVNCGAISPTYADAELFGYAAGAHSGSASSRAGWFGSANGGTLYLDEIGDLPLPIQIKLLAALENHEVTRVGAQQPSPVDVRLVAATSIDLAQAVAAGKFHERLFHYLSEGHLELPPLREQPGNILPLAEYFLGIYSQRLNLAVPLISDAAQQVLEAHHWSGNTRELENVIHFALLVSSGDEILPEHLNLPASVDPLVQVEQLVGKLLLDAKVEQLFALRRVLETVDSRLNELTR